LILTDLVSDYLQYLKLERGLSENTLMAYRRDLDEFVKVCIVKEAEQITPTIATKYVAH